IIIFAQNVFSQPEENPNNQTFKVKNFKLKSNYNFSNVSGLQITFDLNLDNSLKDYFHNPYYVYFKLINDTNVVYVSKKNISIEARKTYGKKISEHKFLSFVIPYSKIKTSTGKHNLILEIFAKNDSKEFPTFFKKQLLVDVPKTYNYKEQEFKITNYRAVANVRSKKIKGVKINYNYGVKFITSQIKGIDVDNNIGKYIFYVKLINTKDNSEVNFFKLKSNEQEIEPVKILNKQEIFIPLNEINLPKGKYKVAVNLYAKTYDQKYFFKILASDTILLNQENLYFINFKLQKCEIANKEFDVSSVIGQLFSNSTSNTGLGYPDVYWTLKTGNIAKFYSKTNKNQLWAIPGKASIIISENDPISFSIMDYDITSFDDLIGEIKLQNTKGNFSKKYNSISFNNVNSADFEYTKIRFPDLEKSSISSKNTQIKGVSGLVCELSYNFSNLPACSNIDVTPFVKFKDKLYKVDYINIDKNTKNIDSQTQNSVVKVFIPYVKIPNKSSIGFIIKDNKLQFIQNKIFENKEIVKPEINDISAKFVNISEKFNAKTKTFGAMISIKWELPDFYKTNVKTIRSKIKIYANNKIFTDTIIDNIKLLNKDKFSIFIPYYKLKNYTGKIDFKIAEQSFVRKYQVGKSKLKFNIEPNNISEIKPKKALIKFKNIDDLNKISIKIYHDNKLVCKSNILDSAKKINFNDIDGKIICSKNDKISISINNVDKFGIEKEILVEDIFVEEFIKHKKIKINSKKSGCKKIKIFL
ncbi:MAG: hypothetical protein DRI94_12100, partial [Bacteroidetes bacterium]